MKAPKHCRTWMTLIDGSNGSMGRRLDYKNQWNENIHIEHLWQCRKCGEVVEK